MKINFSPPALKAIEAAPAGTRISATTPNGICLHGVKASNTLLASPILGTGLPGAQLTHQDAGEPSDDCTEELKTIILAIADCFDVSVPPDPASACLKVMAKIEHFSPDRAIGDGLAIGLDVEELIANCGELARPVKICFNVVRVGCALWGIKTKSSARALGRHDGASV